MVLRGLATLLLVVAGTAPPAIADDATPSPPVVHEVPVTIDATGATDVTGPLNVFFAGVPERSTIALRRGARYRVEGTLDLNRRHDVTLDGNGATIFAGTEGARDRSHLSIENGYRIVIRDLTIKGAHPLAGMHAAAWRPDKAFQHGIRILGAHDVELDRVHITDVFGDLVLIGRSRDGRWSERVWVHNSYLARNGRQGIAVTAARDVVIERNTITDTRRATIDLEPDTPRDGAQNVFVLDNRIGPGWLRFVAAHGNGPVDQVVIAYNRLRGRDLAIDIAPPAGARRSGFYIVGNVSDRLSTGEPLRLTRLDGVVVQGNTQPILVSHSAIAADQVCGLALRDNDFWEAGAIVQSTGPACPTPAAAPMPAPPDLFGRTRTRPYAEVAPAPAAPAAGSTTSRAAPVPGSDGSAPSRAGDVLRVVALAGLGLLVVAFLVVGVRRWIRRRRRSAANEPGSGARRQRRRRRTGAVR